MKENIKLLLTPRMFRPSVPDWEIHGVINPAGIRRKDGKIVLYVRVTETPKNKDKKALNCPVIISESEYKASEDNVLKRSVKSKSGRIIYLKSGECKLLDISHFREIILSKDGFAVEEIDQQPRFAGKPPESEYGVEDPRLTKLGGSYYMTYVSISARDGVSTSLAISKNLRDWKRKGIIFQEQNKDVVLFPEKINNHYVALNRPESSFIFSKPSIWISYSKDLVYWGKEKAILRTRPHSWESKRNGAGPPPIKTEKGWLLIYHGVHDKKNKGIYSAGTALLDLRNPEKVLARSPPNKPLLKPSKIYEKLGYTHNVIFPTAAIPTLDGKSLLIYSGGGDSVITVRELSFKEIFENMVSQKYNE